MGPIGPWVGGNPAEAVEAFFGSLGRILLAVTPAVLQGRSYHLTPRPHTASFGGANPIRLGRRSRFLLDVVHLYGLVAPDPDRSPWRIVTAGYFYELQDRQQRTVVAFHWHPVGHGPVTYPHLHVGGRTSPTDLSKVHFPTGHVSLAAVVSMTITEFEVEPLRSDWRQLLDEAERDVP